jgi:hypothetical protein
MASYKIIGGDGKEYGPVSADELRQWLADGRVAGDTQTQAEGSPGWKPLAEFAELADLTRSTPPPPVSAAPPALPAGKTSGMAIASLVLGILGLVSCGVTSLVGVVLGIVSLRKINRSQGALRGSGLAIAGICISGVFLMFIPIWAALTLPAFSKAKGRAQSIKCASNLRLIGLAGQLWADEHNDTFPADFQSMTNELGTPKILVCPLKRPSVRVVTFAEFDFALVDYELVSPGAKTSDPERVFARCPHHGHEVRADGSVIQRRNR